MFQLNWSDSFVCTPELQVLDVFGMGGVLFGPVDDVVYPMTAVDVCMPASRVQGRRSGQLAALSIPCDCGSSPLLGRVWSKKQRRNWWPTVLSSAVGF
jgi:hypothetical protein